MSPLERELAALLGEGAVRTGPAAAGYLHDMTEMQGLVGRADAVVAPASADQVSRLVAWCEKAGIPMVPRGGGTGFAGGAVPTGGVVVSLERLAVIDEIQPELWRMTAQAGVTTARIQTTARQNGLFYPPDPGAADQSQLGGNIACNAGGPHSFKYGVTGAWVTGLDVVVSGGRQLHLGGATRKDVAPYDLVSLFTGSEGTLGIITGATLRLIPAPEVAWPLVAAFPDAESGCAAIRRVFGFGLQPAILEFLDRGAVAASAASFPGSLPRGTAFAVIAEADGRLSQARELAAELTEALGAGSLAVRLFDEPAAIRDLWRWRNGVSFAVRAQRGGKMSEDVAVPVERLEEAIALTDRLGSQSGITTCSWGHAGDGNLHSTFLLDAADAAEVAAASAAAEKLFAGIRALGGTASGEHGLGLVKAAQLPLQVGEHEIRLLRDIKQLFDPANVFNPGKKVLL